MEAERPSTSPIGALSLVKKFTKFPGGMPERPPGRPCGAAQALARDAQTGGRTPGLKGVRAGARAGACHRPGAVGGGRQTAPVNPSPGAGRRSPAEPLWVVSMGGPLIALPDSAVPLWSGCTEYGGVLGDAGGRDDHDRACEVEGLAGVIPAGTDGAGALVLADLPERTCFLPEKSLFVRWAGASSDAELIAAARAARAALADPGVDREECGSWVTDGPAVLMDSVEAGADLGVEYPDGGMPTRRPYRSRPDGGGSSRRSGGTRRPRSTWCGWSPKVRSRSAVAERRRWRDVAARTTGGVPSPPCRSTRSTRAESRGPPSKRWRTASRCGRPAPISPSTSTGPSPAPRPW
ncbi:Imm21 family immunity protein [Streptomyces koyangensis]